MYDGSSGNEADSEGEEVKEIRVLNPYMFEPEKIFQVRDRAQKTNLRTLKLRANVKQE